MSSDEEFPVNAALFPGSRRRRLQGACDLCRKKKIRCDSAKMPGKRCSNCIASHSDCAHASSKRFKEEYVANLELRLGRMERWFKKFCPHMDLINDLESKSQPSTLGWEPLSSAPSLVTAILADPEGFTISGDPVIIRRSLCELALYARSLEHDLTVFAGGNLQEADASSAVSLLDHNAKLSSLSPPHVVPGDDFTMVPTGDDYANISLAKDMSNISIKSAHESCFGQSSGAMLIQAAMVIKREYAGDDTPITRPLLPVKRPMYWTVRPWELAFAEDQIPNFTFPDDDLLSTLVNLYFGKVNYFIPILHRPTFERSLLTGLHHSDHLFGATVLLVCAIASRYSYDSRVSLDDVDPGHSCGWKYFTQVPITRKSLLHTSSVYELQRYCLLIVYLQGCSAASACWSLVALGIRTAQAFGANRRRNGKPNAEDELWRRSFWVLVCMDKLISDAVGRPCATNYEDFDLDPPIECDDEYWEHPDPELAFKQPPGKPSVMAYFNAWVKLMNIMGFAMRSIYSIKKPKVMLGARGHEWKRRIVGELDSELNRWFDSIPTHLRWDPEQRSQVFLDQSASLYATYHYVQILVHRPFIPSRSHALPVLFPSLAICTNAARSCVHIMDTHSKRGLLPLPHVQMALFHSGIILLLNVWGNSAPGSPTDSNRDLQLADVHKCMNVLQLSESRWQVTGRLWDILNELVSLRENRVVSSTAIDATTQNPSLKTHPNESAIFQRHIGGKFHSQVPFALPSALVDKWINSSISLTSADLRDVQHTTAVVENGAQPVFDETPSVANDVAAFLATFNDPATSSFMELLGQMPQDATYPAADAMQPFSFAPAPEHSPFNSAPTSIWRHSPTRFEFEDWSSYVTSLSEASDWASHSH